MQDSAAWRPGRALPGLGENPCTDVDRVLRQSVWSGGRGCASSAWIGEDTGQRSEHARPHPHPHAHPHARLTEMAELILHHYDISPYAEKIRLAFGLKELS